MMTWLTTTRMMVAPIPSFSAPYKQDQKLLLLPTASPVFSNQMQCLKCLCRGTPSCLLAFAGRQRHHRIPLLAWRTSAPAVLYKTLSLCPTRRVNIILQFGAGYTQPPVVCIPGGLWVVGHEPPWVTDFSQSNYVNLSDWPKFMEL